MQNKTSVSDKVCLITGATSGLGKETALALAKMGATVVIVGRNQTKTQACAEQIKRDSCNNAVDFLIADLASQKSIRQLAHTFLTKYDQLHVLVNDAGVVMQYPQLTSEGIETTFAVNHLAPFLLTNLLLELLKASAPSRIITVSSNSQAVGKINFEDLNLTKDFNALRAYFQSKLANVLFTYELAERLKDTSVTANCVHPGIINSNLGHNNDTTLFKVLIMLSRPLGITPEEAARATTYLAASPQVEGINGKYFSHRKAIPSSKASYDKSLQKRLWEVSEELTQ